MYSQFITHLIAPKSAVNPPGIVTVWNRPPNLCEASITHTVRFVDFISLHAAYKPPIPPPTITTSYDSILAGYRAAEWSVHLLVKMVNE